MMSGVVVGRRAFLCAAAVVILAVPRLVGAEGRELWPLVPPAQWMRALADDLFVPGHIELAHKARQLDLKMQTLCSASSPDVRQQAQAAWRATALVWRRLDVLPIGPTLTRRSLRRFDFWPTRTAQIEAAIAQAPDSMEALARIGVSAQGLPALEYLLFDEARHISISDTPRCRYGELLARAFAEETRALAAAWHDWRAQWNADAGEQEQVAAITDVVNALIGSLEQLRRRKLDKPAQALGRREPLFDAWRSRATRAHLHATLAGVRAVVAGGASGSGMNRVLRGLGYLRLADRLDDDFGRLTAAFDALPVELNSESAAPALERAVAAVARLQASIAGDAATALRVTVGFNESDGD